MLTVDPWNQKHGQETDSMAKKTWRECSTVDPFCGPTVSRRTGKALRSPSTRTLAFLSPPHGGPGLTFSLSTRWCPLEWSGSVWKIVEGRVTDLAGRIKPRTQRLSLSPRELRVVCSLRWLPQQPDLRLLVKPTAVTLPWQTANTPFAALLWDWRVISLAQLWTNQFDSENRFEMKPFF